MLSSNTLSQHVHLIVVDSQSLNPVFLTGSGIAEAQIEVPLQKAQSICRHAVSHMYDACRTETHGPQDINTLNPPMKKKLASSGVKFT